MKTSALIFSLVLFSLSANAQAACSNFVDRTVAPISIDAALSRYASLTPKGEFESSSEYEIRKSTVLNKVLSPLVIAKAAEDRKFLQYDADARKLSIQSYFFHNTVMDFWSAFYSAGWYEKIDVGTMGNIGVVISSKETPTGTYSATNAFGAKATVVKVNRVRRAIFEAEAPIGVYAGALFEVSGTDGVLGTLDLSPAQAQQMKPLFQAAFLVVPKEPYIIKGSHKPDKTTIDNPIDVTESFSVLVADIRCALLLDGKQRVIASFATR